MKKFLITALLGLFMFAIASINAVTIQRDIGFSEELIKSSSHPFIFAKYGSTAELPVNFCQRTEELPFCEVTPVVRSLIFAELIWPKERIDNFITILRYTDYNMRQNIPIDIGEFSKNSSLYDFT